MSRYIVSTKLCITKGAFYLPGKIGIASIATVVVNGKHFGDLDNVNT